MALAVSGHAVHARHNRAAMNRAGLWLFFFSESIVFGLLLSSRFYLKGIEREHVDQLLGLGITAILLLSSVTAFTAENAVEHGNSRLAHWMLLATMALGAIFALGVVYEWATAEFNQREAFGTVFFAMTGLHATHVISGILMLFLAWRFVVKGRFTRESHWGVSGTVMYWHFVDVVWVFYYPALYLVT
jgi:cytochrome c oxidase subunit III